MSKSSGRKTQHVTPHPGGGWQTKRGGASKASGVYKTQAAAIKAGRSISKNQGAELVIHNKQGRIRASDSHGNDPFPPRG